MPSAASRPSARTWRGCCSRGRGPGLFFDTELLVAAERHGYRIHESPSTGSTTPTRVWTSRAPPWRTCGASGGSASAGAPHPRRVRNRAPTVARLPARQFAGLDSEHPRLLASCSWRSNGPLVPTAPTRSPWFICTLGNTAAHRWITFATRAAWACAPPWRALRPCSPPASCSHGWPGHRQLARPGFRRRRGRRPAGRLRLCRLVRFVLLRAWVFRTHLRALHTNGTTGEGSPPGEHNHRRASASPADRRPRRFAAVVALVGAARASGMVRCRRARPSGCSPLVSTPGALAQRRGNTFYAAAVKERHREPEGLFFGSLDPASFITVDKPPASLWLMGLSARSSGSPRGACSSPGPVRVASVLALYAVVRRWAARWRPCSGPGPGVDAIAVAIFRYNNPTPS